MGMIVVQEAGHNPGPKGHSMTTVQSVHVENLVLYGNNFTAGKNGHLKAGTLRSSLPLTHTPHPHTHPHPIKQQMPLSWLVPLVLQLGRGQWTTSPCEAAGSQASPSMPLWRTT